MENPLRKQISSIMKDHKKRQVWYRVVTTLAVVVVFVTTYMLILPAITMENKAECGITEHKHDANCYSTNYEKEKVLACTTESLGVHKHTDACYDAQHKLICGYADFVIHKHDQSCYDADGNLVCQIPEHPLHVHTAECYQMQKQLICTQEESLGHTHTAECYTKEKGNLICGKEEHIHGEGCYDADGNLVCEKEEHTHGDECYEWNDVLTCTIPESAGHTHDASCYQDVQVLVCEEPAELHTHTDACYKDGALVCGKVELKEHVHTDECFKEEDVLVQTLVCDRVEHVHTDECYNKKEEISSEEASTEAISEVETTEGASSQVEESSIEEASTEENSSEEVSTEEVSLEETSTEEASSQIEETSSEVETTSEEVSSEIEETSEEASTEEETTEAESEEESSEEETEPVDVPVLDEQSWCNVEGEAVSEDDQVENGAENDIALFSISLFSNDTGVKLDGYVKKVVVKKIVNGVETDIDPSGIKEGDQLKVDIKYEIPNGLPDGKDTLTYDLPKNFKFTKEMSGSVMQNGSAVGTYTISQDGKITIIIDKDKFDPSKSFTGDVGFEGSAQMTGEEDSEEIKFPGTSESITINRDKTKYDLTVGKQATLSDDRKTIDYTVTVSSKMGTNEELVSITDKFSGDAKGSYKKDTFVLVKVDKDQKETVMNVSPSFTTDENGNQKFDYAKLPALGEGESYKLTYKADVTPNSQGGGTVTNTAGATTPSKQGTDTKNTNIPGTIVEKSGSTEHWPRKLIKWVITINKDQVADVGGYKISDVLPGTLDTQNGIKIDPALPDGTTTITSFPFTFPDNAGKKKYTITYYTIPPTTQQTVTNTVTAEKGGEKYESTGETTYYPRSEGVGKTFVGEGKDQEKDVLNWSSKIDISEEDQTEVTYIDTILPTTDKDGKDVKDEDGKNIHYAIASKLMETLTKDNNIQLKLENGTELNYNAALAAGYQFEFKFCEAKDSTEISSTDTSAHVGYFTVKVSKTNGETFRAQSLTLKYFTYADYSSMSEGDKWTLKNQANYHDKQATAENKHGTSASSSLKKESGVKKYGNISYTTPSSVAYSDAEDGYLYYRLILTTSSDQNDDLVITDTLSDSGMTFDVDSLETKFTRPDNLYDQWCDWTGYGGGSTYKYSLEENKKPTVSVDGQTMTITIKGGYNKGKIGETVVYDSRTGKDQPHTFVITYRVKFSDDSYWNDPNVTFKKYGNIVTWENLTDSTETEIKDRIVENVEKSGKQRLATDKDGKVIYDNNGNPTYLETVDYQIVINPKGQDLLENSDWITLVDKLTIEKEYGGQDFSTKNIKAYLEMDSVKLYRYDKSAENGMGSLIDRSAYILHYDNSNANAPILTVEIPDQTPCILVYSYTFDKGSLTNAYQVKNEAQLSGSKSSSKSLKIEKNSSYASVDQSELSIYKVDQDDQSVRLGNAKFKLEEYSNEDWKVVSYANPAINGGTKEGTGNDTLYVTNQDGYLRFEKYNTDSSDNESNGFLKKDTIYRLTEVVAPIGYQLNSTPYYFVIRGDAKLSDLETEMNKATGGTGNVNYFNVGNKVAIYITDKFTGFSVKKVWLDENGNVQASGMPDSIQVQLYQQTDPTGTKTPFGNVIILSAKNNWSYTWQNALPATDGNGNLYYYSVGEVGIPSGYSVSYTNIDSNGTIIGGNEMVITNKKDKQPITLPETGGIGTYWYTLGGLLLIAGALLLMYRNSMRKGGKRTGNRF